MKTKKKENPKKIEFDLELLRHWKKVSTKAKLDWLQDAMRLAKLKKF